MLRCDNCSMMYVDAKDLEPVENLLERVAPGEKMPYGQCPDCGAVVHEMESIKPREARLEYLHAFMMEHYEPGCFVRDGIADLLHLARRDGAMVVEDEHRIGWMHFEAEDGEEEEEDA